jgi:hypothetical protein
MLAKCTLNPSARSGRRHSVLTGQHTRARLQRWLGGERSSLWQDSVPRPTKAKPPEDNKASRKRRALDMVEEDRLGPACAVLGSSGSAPNNQTTFRQLQDKHPAGQAPAAEAQPPRQTPAPTFVPEAVLKGLLGFPPGSGAGSSGLRPQHLLEGVRSPAQRVALEALTDALNVLVAGRVPPSLAPALAGASLSALVKDGGDVRPIAVGETIRRLTSKCLCAEVKDEAALYLRPLQVGVACPMGAEAVIRSLTQYVERHSSSVHKLVLKVDFANAFNTVDRESFLRAATLHTPAVAKWAWWCYSQPTTLHYNSAKLTSSAGVQQGDNIGPLLFSLALHPTLLQLQELRDSGAGLEFVAAYLDDVVVAGDAVAVLSALRILEAAAPGIGLHLKPSKCELIPTAGHNSSVDLDAFPEVMKRRLDGCFDILGAPVGAAEHCNSYIQVKRVEPAAERLSQLGDLEDAHAAYKIMSTCMGSCKMMYAMRTSRPDWVHAAFAQFDGLAKTSFENTVGASIAGDSWAQAKLSTSQGGLGFRSAAEHAPAAFLASAVSTWDLCRVIDPLFVWEGALASSGLSAAAGLFNSQLPPGTVLNFSVPPVDPKAFGQKQMSAILEETQITALRSNFQPLAKARLRAAAAPHAGAWLSAPACKAAGLRLTSAEFSAAALFRVGATVIDADTWCPKCDQVLGATAAHAVSCRGGGDITVRHNSLRDECFYRCLAAGFQAEREESGLLPSDPLRRPGDVVVRAFPGSGPAALDFAVTCPLQASMREVAAQHTLAAAMAYESHKLGDRNTASLCQAQGLTLIPMIAETLGGWGPAAQHFFQVLARSTAERTGVPDSVAVGQLYQALGIRLQRANARSILTRSAATATRPVSTTLAANSRSEAALLLTAAMDVS